MNSYFLCVDIIVVGIVYYSFLFSNCRINTKQSLQCFNISLFLPLQRNRPNNSRSPKKQQGSAYATRKRPLWDNCELLAPDGQQLCTCSISKGEWYLTKGLGHKVSNDPLIVKLRQVHVLERILLSHHLHISKIPRYKLINYLKIKKIPKKN